MLLELKNGLPYRTIPPGIVIDWHSPDVERGLNVEASEVTFTRGVFSTEGDGSFGLGLDRPIVGIEVLPPTDAEVSAPSAGAPTASPPGKVSEADLQKALLGIVEEHPQGSPPLDEGELWRAVEKRLDAKVSRDRVLKVRDAVASHFKLPVGRPRKNAQ